jgi:hypothetical protein
VIHSSAGKLRISAVTAILISRIMGVAGATLRIEASFLREAATRTQVTEQTKLD